MKKAKKCLHDWTGEFEFIDEEGTIIYGNKNAIFNLIEIAYIEGILEYAIWADVVPDGNRICDEYEDRLKELMK